MDQEKRVLLAFVLSIGMLAVWRIFFVKPPPPRNTPAPSITTQPVTPAAGQPAGPGAPAAAAPKAAAVTLRVEQGTQPEDIVVESDLYRVTFSTRGAVVKSWVLKKYRDASEQPLDVVDSAACQTLGYPMSVNVMGADGTPDAALGQKLDTALFVTRPSHTLFAAPDTVEFTYSDGAIQVKKRFTFEKTYELHVEASVFDGQNYRPVEVRWPGGFGDHSLSYKLRDAANRTVYGAPGSLTTVVQVKLKEDRTIPGPLTLAGLEDRFFVAIFLPDSPDVFFGMDRRPWTPPDWKEGE
ncbi:MAG TPA: membrane protein insertase YidC, partial [Terriglobia bacterium]|nr:membrane protein insertase YidC [Terriglobia bacterium]